MKGHWTCGAPGAEVAERAAAAASVHARDGAGDGQGTGCHGLPAGAGLPDVLGDTPEPWNPPPALLWQGASQTPWVAVPSVLLFVGILGLMEVALVDVREVHVRGVRERAN